MLKGKLGVPGGAGGSSPGGCVNSLRAGTSPEVGKNLVTQGSRCGE